MQGFRLPVAGSWLQVGRAGIRLLDYKSNMFGELQQWDFGLRSTLKAFFNWQLATGNRPYFAFTLGFGVAGFVFTRAQRVSFTGAARNA
jgi:hypothetical protein